MRPNGHANGKPKGKPKKVTPKDVTMESETSEVTMESDTSEVPKKVETRGRPKAKVKVETRGRPKAKVLPVEQENPWEHQDHNGQKGYGGQLTLEAKIVALTLRHCHHLFVRQDDQGDLEQVVQPLGYKKIANAIVKTNGQRPSFAAIRKICDDAEKRGGLFNADMKRKKGSGRPPIYSEEQCSKIASNLMLQKLSRGYPFS